MNDILIIGHKNPDTDSIAAALSYAYLKRQLGFNASAYRLGPLNEETKYALRYFNLENPDIIYDARSHIKEIDIDEATLINYDESCNVALNKVINSNNSTLFVIKDEKMVGVLSISDLTSLRFMNNKKRSSLLSSSPIDLIAKDLKAKIYYASKNYQTNGIVKIYESDIDEEYDLAIVIARKDKHLDDILVYNPALVILIGDKVEDDILEKYINKDISLITCQLYVEDILRIIYDCVKLEYLMSRDVISYSGDEFIEDIKTSIINTRFRCYPVIDDEGRVIGSISRYHLLNYRRKNFILVDHSSYIQSINNLRQANILEIIDHHNIGDITTSSPIYYRNQLCGSSCSIIYEIYKENKINIPMEIAGMMLSAIISDTLYFKSNTTTKKDIEYANELASIAKVNLDKYANDLLNASVNLKDVKFDELIQRDLKSYNIDKYKIAIGQTNYNSLQDVQIRLNEFKEEIIKYNDNNHFDLLILMFTNVKAEGSLFIFTGPKTNILTDIIESKIDEMTGFDSHIVSRKQQLIPMLSKAIENV